MLENLKIGLIKTLILIKDYLPEIVLGGGWVPLMYQHYYLGNKAIFPMLTRDIDFMVNNKVPIIENKSIDTILTEAGLKPEFYGQGNKPVVHYSGKIGGHEVAIEFLTDLRVKEIKMSLRYNKV